MEEFWTNKEKRWRYLFDEINSLKTMVGEIKTKQEEFMAQVFNDLNALRQAINDATNAVAARLDALSGQIKNSMTDDEVATLKADLQGEVDRLNALAADPNNPVP